VPWELCFSRACVVMALWLAALPTVVYNPVPVLCTTPSSRILHAAAGWMTDGGGYARVSPGIVKQSIALPDVHSGYGFAIGNVAAFDMADPEAVVSPGGVGFDINCGVRLVRTNLTLKVKYEHPVTFWDGPLVGGCIVRGPCHAPGVQLTRRSLPCTERGPSVTRLQLVNN
jgi:hypothetical protein